jgi:hypothetical protein
MKKAPDLRQSILVPERDAGGNRHHILNRAPK